MDATTLSMGSSGATAASSGTTTTTMTSLVQKASQQYLECRRQVSAKVEEVKAVDKEIETLFQQIAALSEAQVDGSAPTTKKSVGKLEVQVLEVDGPAPVPGARIVLELDEEEDEEQEQEQEQETEKVQDEKKEEAATEGGEDASKTKEPEDAEATPPAMTRSWQMVEPVVREVRWEDGAAFPATFVFERVPSRDSVVTISVLPPKEEGEEEEGEPVKEVELSIASLLEGGSKVDLWYLVKEVKKKIIRTKTTTVRKIKKPVEEQKQEDAPKSTEAEAPADKDAPKPATEAPASEVPAVETPAPAEKTNESAKEEEKKEEDKKEEAPAPVAVENPDDVQVHVEKVEEIVTVPIRFHIQATFLLSEVERLSQAAVTISKKKQDLEAELAVLDREAASLRTKYERLNASQRALSANATANKSRVASLLGAANLRKEKSRYQKTKEAMSALFSPHRRQLMLSGAMFVGSVALFHFQGHNLLA